MPVSDVTQRVLSQLKSRRVISVLTAPANRLADLRALILLSQMVYWTIKDADSLKSQGWMLKPAGEWCEETRLSRNYYSRSQHMLIERGVVKAWRQASRSAPWIRVDLEALCVLCQGKPAPQAISLEQFIHNQDYRDRLIGKSMPYFTVLADVADGDALQGMFLSRCIYWQEMLERRNRLEEARTAWGWSSTDWSADLGLSRAQLRLAVRQAEEQGLLARCEINRPFAGISVDMERLEQTIKAIIMPVTKHESGPTIAGYDQPAGTNSTDEPLTTTRRTGVGEVDDVTVIFPESIPNTEHDLMRRLLRTADPERRQPLLDELAGRLMSGATVRNRPSLLRFLIQQDQAEHGGLVLEYAHRVEAARKATQAHEHRLRVSQAIPRQAASEKPAEARSISSQDRGLRSAAMFEAIGMKRQADMGMGGMA